jgi:hypothetical protein
VRADRDLAGGRHEQRVAVGRGGRGELRADHAIGAGLVLDHERLPEQRTDVLAEVAGQNVDAAAASPVTMNWRRVIMGAR